MTPPKSKPVIGIVGGVCAGKSTVAEELVSLGCLRIDGDRVGHELLAEAEVRQEIRRRWGEAVFTADGAVNRKALGEIAFADRADLDALNAILWPRIRRRIEAAIGEAQADAGISAAAVDAAVLFEAGWDDLCTHVLFVAAPEEVRLQRALRRGWDRQKWRQREKSQIPLDIKAARCYASLENSSCVSHLREQTRQAFYRIVQGTDGY